ncbi:MAG: CBS domain-containing protein [Polyangia bacterium]
MPTLREFMTPSPHTIGDEQPLATAQHLMRTHGCRHLPVLRSGELVGMVSERDVLLMLGLPGVDPNLALVEEAMTEPAVALAPTTSLEWVAAEMAQRRLGSVVVVESTRVVGVFTCVDALVALQTLLARARRRGKRATARPARKRPT